MDRIIFFHKFIKCNNIDPYSRFLKSENLSSASLLDVSSFHFPQNYLLHKFADSDSCSRAYCIEFLMFTFISEVCVCVMISVFE